MEGKINIVRGKIIFLTILLFFGCKIENAPNQDTSFVKEDVMNINQPKKILNGTWRLDSIEVDIARIPSYCDNLSVGSLFVFYLDGTLEVFTNESKQNRCGYYSYQISETKLILFEDDMAIEMSIKSVTADSLILLSKFIQKNLWTEESVKILEQGYRLYLTPIQKH